MKREKQVNSTAIVFLMINSKNDIVAKDVRPHLAD